MTPNFWSHTRERSYEDCYYYYYYLSSQQALRTLPTRDFPSYFKTVVCGITSHQEEYSAFKEFLCTGSLQMYSTQMYSDVELNKSEWHGLLSFSVKYATQKGACTSYYFYLDILGDDHSSLRKHPMRNLIDIDITKTLKDKFALQITLRFRWNRWGF